MALKTRAERVGDVFIYAILIIFAAFCIYPLIYIFSNAISSPDAVKRMEVVIWPVGFSLESFRYIVEHEYLGISYLNSFFYTIAGTVWQLLWTTIGAYVLSRKYLIGRNAMMFLIWFTMMFSGGLIPLYLVVNDLGMVGTRWALIIPCAVSQYYLIIMKTSMQELPSELEESAKIDGANSLTVMMRIILPVSIPTIMTIALFFAVGRWNSYFDAIIYLRDKAMYPLQAILRELLVTFTDKSTDGGTMAGDYQKNFSTLGFRCATILVSLIPVMIAYPFVQKYFVKGVMIGSIKG